MPACPMHALMLAQNENLLTRVCMCWSAGVIFQHTADIQKVMEPEVSEHGTENKCALRNAEAVCCSNGVLCTWKHLILQQHDTWGYTWILHEQARRFFCCTITAGSYGLLTWGHAQPASLAHVNHNLCLLQH